ncbi:MAG: glycosyltransferase family 4 protein [Candidatus Cloacimonetes bacterium]|nr:glycosyltransferase family 4 protein [Candidatus Cloacimonadota bacterium]
MKKLLIITNLYPHQYNSAAGIFVYYQAMELAKHYDVHVAATCDKYPYDIQCVTEDTINVTRIFYPYWQRYFLSSLLTYRFFAIPQLKSIIINWQPDLIHVHNYRHVPELVWLKPLLNKFNIPTFLTLHNIRTHPDRLPGNPLRWFYKQGLPIAFNNWTHIFTVNSRLVRWVEPFLPSDRITVIGNGILPFTPKSSNIEETSNARQKSDCFKIISVGNLVTEKGFATLVDAVHLLIKEGFKLQLVIVGEGDQRNQLIQQISRYKLNDCVTLTGALPNQQVRDMYQNFDAFVLPSYSETFGIVYIEAMYAGIPVIGVMGEGIAEFAMQGVHALFAKPKDSIDLAKQLKFLIQNPEQVKAIAESGCKLVNQNFMISKIIERIAEVYER